MSLNLLMLSNCLQTADQVGKLTVFNIGGNKTRLITAIYSRIRLQADTVIKN